MNLANVHPEVLSLFGLTKDRPYLCLFNQLKVLDHVLYYD